MIDGKVLDASVLAALAEGRAVRPDAAALLADLLLQRVNPDVDVALL